MADAPVDTARGRVDLDDIYQLALKGILRCHYFLAFGVNAARGGEQSNFDFPGAFRFVLINRKPTSEETNHLKDEFEAWVVGSALREMIEVFSVFLVKLHSVCLKLNRLPSQEVASQSEKFDRLSFSGKLKTLADEFQIDSGFLQELTSIQIYRNCLTHRLGIVGSPDLNHGTKMLITWRCVEVFLKADETGEETPFPRDMREPFLVEQESSVFLRPNVVRTREFNLGQLARLEPYEISEISFMFFNAADRLRKSILKFARSNGILIVEKPPAQGNI